MRGADCGMAGKRDFGVGGEDVNLALIGGGGGLVEKDDFGEVEFGGYGLLLGLREGVFGFGGDGDYCYGIAGVGGTSEGVEGGEG